MSIDRSAPPRAVLDGRDRRIDLRPADDDAPATDDVRSALRRMYDAFGRSDRAQGVPPSAEDDRREWVATLSEGIGIVAWHDGDAVGHAVLLDDRHGGHELAVFVHPQYRRAGVGTRLLRTLVGRGRGAGVERVWLSVARTNRPAVALYRSLGFETTSAAGPEMTMERRL
jgi:ribosomal protein S18 acetylase RimI-like enzyme